MGPVALPSSDLAGMVGMFGSAPSQPDLGTQSSAAQEFPWHAFIPAVMASPVAGLPPGAAALEAGAPLTTAATAACVKVETADAPSQQPRPPRQPLRSARARAARASTASADGADDTDEGPPTRTRSNAFDTASLDPRRAARILANRQSAQRSRMKRLQHVHDLEAQAAGLAEQVASLQQRLDRESARAREAAAAAQAAAAAAAALRAQVERQEAAQRELRALVVALRRQAAAQGLQVSALSLPPAAPPPLPLPPVACGSCTQPAAAQPAAGPHSHMQQQAATQQEEQQHVQQQSTQQQPMQQQATQQQPMQQQAMQQQAIQQQQRRLPSAQPDLAPAQLASPPPCVRGAAAAAVAGFASPVDMDGDFASLLGADVHAALFGGSSQEDADLFGFVRM
ncbi:hypothetical protein Rsub_00488 [Raphidocelis subcapitata]|uniref:BZIP domain-containing protein n=1 Tax=Raphidocelis subcapitata TaxID=307507 RepID=A0A2V0NS63_9CHLO|nr:hypothetical protein Rsub_00488 [Raphidocelis subcapitata]|eukprot:GBF87777.1 hypothetical protein Rsub_00488 [Raphidocelis subcapitata]